MGLRFAVAAAVHIEPLGMCSGRTQSLADVPAGGIVSLSNRVSNTRRGLSMLQGNGLIRLQPEEPGMNANLDDVIEISKNLRFVEIAPPQLPRSQNDATLAVITGNYALEAEVEPARDALALDRAEGNPYANVLVTTEALAKDPRVQRLATLLTSATSPPEGLAEGAGFEPAIRFPVYTLSRRAPSTTRPPLRPRTVRPSAPRGCRARPGPRGAVLLAGCAAMRKARAAGRRENRPAASDPSFLPRGGSGHAPRSRARRPASRAGTSAPWRRRHRRGCPRASARTSRASARSRRRRCRT